MTAVNVMALFCEDIREEKDGVVSLIGIIPDNVNVDVNMSALPSEPSAPPKIGTVACTRFG